MAPSQPRPVLTARGSIAASRHVAAPKPNRRTLARVARKRKTVYPPARTDTRQPPQVGTGPEPFPRPTVASIDLSASRGRAGLSVGDRVRITGAGLYSGEAAVIERIASGVIPAAMVRTEAGKTRQVRTIDLEPLRDG